MLIARRAFRTAGDPRASLGVGALLVTVLGPRSALLGVLGCPTLPFPMEGANPEPCSAAGLPSGGCPLPVPNGPGLSLCPTGHSPLARLGGSFILWSLQSSRSLPDTAGWGRARPNVRAAAQAVGSGPGSAVSRIPISQLSDPIQLCLSVPTGHPGNSTWQGRGPRTGPCPPAPCALRTRPAAHSRAGTEGTQTRPERAPLPFRLCLLQRLPRNSGPA